MNYAKIFACAPAGYCAAWRSALGEREVDPVPAALAASDRLDAAWDRLSSSSRVAFAVLCTAAAIGVASRRLGAAARHELEDEGALSSAWLLSPGALTGAAEWLLQQEMQARQRPQSPGRRGPQRAAYNMAQVHQRANEIADELAAVGLLFAFTRAHQQERQDRAQLLFALPAEAVARLAERAAQVLFGEATTASPPEAGNKGREPALTGWGLLGVPPAEAIAGVLHDLAITLARGLHGIPVTRSGPIPKREQERLLACFMYPEPATQASGPDARLPLRLGWLLRQAEALGLLRAGARGIWFTADHCEAWLDRPATAIWADLLRSALSERGLGALMAMLAAAAWLPEQWLEIGAIQETLASSGLLPWIDGLWLSELAPAAATFLGLVELQTHEPAGGAERGQGEPEGENSSERAYYRLTEIGRRVVDRLFDAVREAGLERLDEIAAPVVREENDLYITANQELLVPSHVRPAVRFRLAQFTETAKVDAAEVLRLTPESLDRAAVLGWTADRVLAVLTSHSRAPMPQNVVYLIRDRMKYAGRLATGAATLVRCDTAEVADALCAHPFLGPLFERLNPRDLATSAWAAPVLPQVLGHHGFWACRERAEMAGEWGGLPVDERARTLRQLAGQSREGYFAGSGLVALAQALEGREPLRAAMVSMVSEPLRPVVLALVPELRAATEEADQPGASDRTAAQPGRLKAGSPGAPLPRTWRLVPGPSPVA